MGVNGKDYQVPEEYIDAEVVFQHYYDLGAKERQEKQQRHLSLDLEQEFLAGQLEDFMLP